MKKLITVLVVIMLVTGLLAGCGIMPESKLWKIEVEPTDFGGITLYVNPAQFPAVDGTCQLEVTAFYDDGTIADVTLDCEYISSDSKIAFVSNEGLITAIKVGDATISVIYTQQNFWTSDITRTAKVEITVGKK